EDIQKKIEEYQLEIEDIIIVDAREEKEIVERYAQHYYNKRQRKGVTLFEARKLMRQRNYFGTMMVELGDADSIITGQTVKYSTGVKPLFEILGMDENVTRVAGMYIMLSKRGPMFFADTTISESPSADDIVKIAINVSDAVRRINLRPKIAMLSYSNFGSHKGETPTKMYEATKRLKEIDPNLVVDGEMQANFALDNELLEEVFPFSDLVNNRPNIFIFPDLAASNIAYKMLQGFGSAEAIGPLLIGLKKSAHVLQMGSSVREIVNMATMAAVDAQTRKEGN
ncbi:MAG: phosphate acyltransferase, partial [Schleiferiaceae bacterium]|nr:phosphate acyltransferase [Schleiferiaceae bacterium]